jgi:hypothetical protein
MTRNRSQRRDASGRRRIGFGDQSSPVNNRENDPNFHITTLNCASVLAPDSAITVVVMEPSLDVSISFLAKDEPFAAELYARLEQTLKVFFFPRQQDRRPRIDAHAVSRIEGSSNPVPPTVG